MLWWVLPRPRRSEPAARRERPYNLYDRDYSRYAVGSLCHGILYGFESEYFSRATPGVEARNLDPVHNISLD